MSKEMGKTCLPSLTCPLKNHVAERGKMRGQKEGERWQKTGRCWNRQGKQVKEVEEDAKRHVESATEVKLPPQRKQPPLVKNAEEVWGIVIIWTKCVESYSADSDVDPKRRYGKLDKTRNPRRALQPKGQR